MCVQLALIQTRFSLSGRIDFPRTSLYCCALLFGETRSQVTSEDTPETHHRKISAVGWRKKARRSPLIINFANYELIITISNYFQLFLFRLFWGHSASHSTSAGFFTSAGRSFFAATRRVTEPWGPTGRLGPIARESPGHCEYPRESESLWRVPDHPRSGDVKIWWGRLAKRLPSWSATRRLRPLSITKKRRIGCPLDQMWGMKCISSSLSRRRIRSRAGCQAAVLHQGCVK